MSDLQRALDSGSDYDLDEYLSMVGPEQFRSEVEELAQPSSTLRDQFAMAALTGLIAHQSGECPHKSPEVAYVIADAMLKARAAQEGE